MAMPPFPPWSDKKERGLVDKLIHVSVTDCFKSDGMEYGATPPPPKKLYENSWKVQAEESHCFSIKICDCSIIILTMHVFLVFRGGKAPL
jgi:hypothetical protein